MLYGLNMKVQNVNLFRFTKNKQLLNSLGFAKIVKDLTLI